MNSINREASRVSSTSSNITGSEKNPNRPSLLSKAYNSVSHRGSRVGSRLSKVSSNRSGGGSGLGESAGKTNLQSFSGVFPIPEKGSRRKPIPELTKEEKEKYEQMLEYFSNQKDFPISLQANETKREPASDWEKLRLLSKESLLRYLRACRWDVTAAKKRLTETIAWRREFGVDELDSDEMAKEAKSGKETVLGFDKTSRPLHYMHPHRNDTPESPRQMQFAVWILERCIDLMPPGTEQLALLINFDHKSRNPTSIANAKLMLYILQNHYVERLGIALCINVPWVFKIFWNAIQPFIDPVTKSKCKFDEAIKDEVPAGQLSSEFGGDLDAKYNHDQYWPDLVKLSSERRKEMMRRFKDDCKSEIGASEWIIRGGDDETSPFNAKDLAAPSELTTTSASSEVGPSNQGQGGEKAREAAVVASDNRAETSVETSNYSEPPTPLEKYKTPTEMLNASPLDRKFSTTSSVGNPKGSAVSGLETTEEKPVEEEGEAAKLENGQHVRSGSHISVASGFKDFNHKIHDSFHNAFHHSDKSSRRSSRDSKRRSGGNVEDKEGRKSSNLKKEQKEAEAETDRKENVETGEDLSTNASGRGTMPSTTETAKVAATGGLGGALASAMGIKASEKVPGGGAEDAKGSEDAATTTTINMFFFAAAKEAAGIGSEKIALPESPFPLSKLGDHLIKMVAEGTKGNSQALEKVLKQSRWSVDEDMVEDDDLGKIALKGGEDVAIIPPVSGG